MSVKIERERKYLVKPPISWEDLAALFDGIVDVKRIEQTYLTSKEGQQAARVRKTISGLVGEEHVQYHFNRKKPTKDTGAHEETEYQISKQEYEDYLEQADPHRCEVQKTRFVFKYHDQVFELDIFKGHLQGLAILEIELENQDDTVELPPFLQVIKDITKNKNYSNYNLAQNRR